jgi:cobalt-zinc-cadmium efflux system membrane fusion protein
MSLKNMTTRISRKHLIAVALIIAFGGAAGVLHSAQWAEAASERESHAHAEEHGDAEHHGAQRQTKAHADNASHGDAEHHAQAASSRERTAERSLRTAPPVPRFKLDESAGEPVMRVWLLDNGKPIAPWSHQSPPHAHSTDG